MRANPSPNFEVAPYILALRAKLADKAYIDGAIQRLAHILSAQIIEDSHRKV